MFRSLLKYFSLGRNLKNLYSVKMTVGSEITNDKKILKQNAISYVIKQKKIYFCF